VVDVEVGVAREPLVDEVDEGLERDPLGLVVVRVERLEVAVDVEDPQRYSAGRPSQNGLPSKSKKRSPGEASGRSAKPASGRLEEPEGVGAGLARDELGSACSRFLAQLSALMPAGTGSAGLRPSCATRRRDPGRLESLDLRPVDPGAAGEVVDRSVRVAGGRSRKCGGGR
jgi:hypothetical protein